MPTAPFVHGLEIGVAFGIGTGTADKIASVGKNHNTGVGDVPRAEPGDGSDDRSGRIGHSADYDLFSQKQWRHPGFPGRNFDLFSGRVVAAGVDAKAKRSRLESVFGVGPSPARVGPFRQGDPQRCGAFGRDPFDTPVFPERSGVAGSGSECRYSLLWECEDIILGIDGRIGRHFPDVYHRTFDAEPCRRVVSWRNGGLVVRFR